MALTRNALEAAYQAVRDRIESGALVPGDWLREATLSEELGISRTPVREALRALATEGLVETVPNRGARVARWSAHDVDELYRLRGLLEGYGAGEAARRGGAAVAPQLWDSAARYAQESTSGTYDSAVACNFEFHEAVLAVAGSPRLVQLVQQVRSAMLVRRAFAVYSEDDRLRSVIQHRDIVRAIERGDAELAELAMRTHILAARYSAMEATGP